VIINELSPSHRERIYSPLDTLHLFVGQVLSADRACQAVVGRRLSERIAQGQSLNALNTGSYCDARQRLPIQLPVTLGTMLGARLEAIAPLNWRWQGRSVKLFDGTTVTMPNMPSNSAAIHKAGNRSRGLVSPSPVLAHSLAYPAARYSVTKWPPARAKEQVSKACWQMRCWRLGG